MHFIVVGMFVLLTFNFNNCTLMENYVIVLGMYLILMLFFKIFFSVSATKGE